MYLKQNHQKLNVTFANNMIKKGSQYNKRHPPVVVKLQFRYINESFYFT